MNPWRDLFRTLQAELDRLSQEVDGRRVLPNAIDVALPIVHYERWAPVLEAVTGEVGEALVDWARHGRRDWYRHRGPFLTVHLESCSRPEIVCDFRQPAADPTPAEAGNDGPGEGSDSA